MRLPRFLAGAVVVGAALVLLAVLVFGRSANEYEKLALDNPCANRSAAEIAKEEARERGEGRKQIDKESAREEIANEGCELQEPSDVMLTRQLFGNDAGVTPPDIVPAATRQANAVAAQTRNRAPGVSDAQWSLEGPTSIGGRVLDIALDPDDKDVVFIATASGGVWKSTDAGSTFQPSWPDRQAQPIGALVNTPSGVLFAGTGETGPGGGSITYGGDGLYRSKDKGRTWQKVGLEGTSRIGRILVDPTNEKRILVAASGNLFKPTKERGVYLSEDGGDSWKKVLSGDNETTGATDLASNADGSIMFATTWDHQRQPDLRRYEGPGTALYKSTDKGKTWSKVLTGPFHNNPQGGRMGVVTGTGNEGKNIAFVITTSASGTFGGIWKSTDGGTTWTPRGDVELTADGSFVYGWWFGRLWIDPKDTNHLWVPGVALIESKDGGNTYTEQGGTVGSIVSGADAPHADQHAMVWDPRVPNRVYLGNDGGLYRSDQNGAEGTWKFAKYQPFSQPYTLDVSEQDRSRIVTGLQDNGVNKSWGRKDGTWVSYHGGDGERALIKPTNKDFLYGCHQYGECTVHPTGSTSGQDFTRRMVSARRNWTMPIEFDPEDPRTIYSGGEFLERSDDDAGSFRVISPDLSNGPGREPNPLFRNYGTITTIAPAGKSKKVMYAGTDDGNLWYTANQDDPAAWKKAADPDLPKAWITRVEVNRANPKVAYVTYSGFRTGEDAAYLLRTRDGGATWDNITGDLPKAPLNDVNIVGDALFVASDFGVFVSRDEGKSWFEVGGNLPKAPVFELRYHAPSNRLYAATFGRSIWSIALADLGKVPGVGKSPAEIKGESPFAGVPGIPKAGSQRSAPQTRLGLSSRKCVASNRLRFKLKRPRGVRVKSLRITINNKRVKGRSLSRATRGRAVTLRLPRKAKKITIAVTLRARDGRTFREKRVYTRCKAKKKQPRKRRLG